MSDRKDETLDFELAKAIRDLDREMPPSRDLWAGIERNIIDHPQKQPMRFKVAWVPVGVAASLLVGLLSLGLTLTRSPTAAPEMVSYDQSIDNMQAEYVRVRNPLVQTFNETNQNADPAVMEDLYHNIEIMEQARREIEDQVRANPENRRLVEMLMRIHEQELELLKRDYSQPTHSM